MLGKLAGAVLGLCIGVSVTLAVTSCAASVSQNARTGDDGKEKGAKPITLDNGEGKAKGIVTYPGGDRVDWKLIELPEKTMGTLSFELKWVPPRPGLQLSFDVFDEWGQEIVQSKKQGKGRKVRIRTAEIERAVGKYYLRIYAVNRGDAGKYTMTVDFKAGDGIIDWAKIDIPDPPRLAAVPVEIEACDDFNFDPKKPECRTFCPAANAPPGWPPCASKCPDPPDPAKQACWDKVCPAPPTTASKMCMSNPKKYFPPCPSPTTIDPDNPNCPKNAPPISTRVVDISQQGNDVLITLPVGSERGVTTDWKGTLLRGDSTDALDGGEIQIVRVAAKQTLGKVHLTPDQVNRNLKAKLTPPAR
jgi:hypothetical protein